MSSSENEKQAMKDYLGLDDYQELWKAIKEDLHARVLAAEEDSK